MNSDLTEQLDAMYARLAAAAPGAITITPSDIHTLLVLARKQQAAIDRVAALADEIAEGASHSLLNKVIARGIREALETA